VSARAALRVALLALLLLLVQTTVVLSASVGGVHADLLWLLPITAALLAGPGTGAIVGFWSGLAFDLVLPTPFGLGALVGCLLGFATGMATAAVDREVVWLRPLTAVVGSVAADMLFAVLGAIFGQQQMVQIDFFSLFLVVAVASALVVLPVHRMMRWALAGDGSRRTLVAANSTESGLW
jgi:rod shape-determining protein MreD